MEKEYQFTDVVKDQLETIKVYLNDGAVEDAKMYIDLTLEDIKKGLFGVSK